jgi:putative methyltransferase (TIGR04325 family)
MININHKSIIKRLLPDFFIRTLTGFFYGWHGNYSSWAEAKSKCLGYSAANILEKVKESTMKVKNGEAAFERDSVTFNKIEYSFPVLSALMWIAAQNGGKINVLDFGGALGSSYFQYKSFLESLNEYKWNIVEQENFVNEGKINFSTKNLKFYPTIDDCLQENQVDFVLLSSVIQYLEYPYGLLHKISEKKIKYIMVDRTGFIKKPDRITIQKVPTYYYKATYPCWFFNYKIFITHFKSSYNLIFEFDTKDKANIRSIFKGFLFENKHIS